MIAHAEAGDAIERIGHDVDAAREGRQLQPHVAHVIAETRAQFALGFRLQHQIDAKRLGRCLPRVVVRRIANAAKAEDDVARGKAAP